MNQIEGAISTNKGLNIFSEKFNSNLDNINNISDDQISGMFNNNDHIQETN